MHAADGRGVEDAADVGRVAVALSGATLVEDVLDVVEAVAYPAMRADGLLLSLVRDHRVQLVRHAGYEASVTTALASLPLDTPSPMAETAAARTPLFLSSPSAYLTRYPHLAALVAQTGKQAWAFLPLVTSGMASGTLLVSWVSERPFDAADRSRLLALAALCAQSLERARLLEGTQQVAAALQRALLPEALPVVRQLGFASRYAPAAQPELTVGGDWYDAVLRTDGTCMVSIGDVVGHDVHAAALMGEVRHSMRAFASEGHGPAGVLQRVNDLLAAGNDEALLRDATGQLTERLATCCYLQLDTASGVCTTVSAGHPPPVLLRRGTAPVQLAVEAGLPLGVLADAAYRERTTVLEPGDVLVLFTDGLVEAPTLPLGEGIARLLELLGTMPAADIDPEQLADAVLAAGPASSGDDVALLVLRYEPGGARARRARRRFADEAVSVPLARLFATDVLSAWGAGDLLDVSALVVTEMVTNAVAHTVGHSDLRLTLEEGSLLVEVTDTSPRLPPDPDPDGGLDDDAEGGRGLHIVRALARDWGVHQQAVGKVVWARLDRAGDHAGARP